MVELTPLQISLIVALLIVGPGGYWNMQRLKRKKREEEEAMLDLGQNSQDDPPLTSSLDFQVNSQIKEYIEKYSSSYSREGIASALRNSGYSQEDIEKHLDAFYKQ
jgi:hypothetical protein